MRLILEASEDKARFYIAPDILIMFLAGGLPHTSLAPSVTRYASTGSTLGNGKMP
jgi:hypothetical protein